MVFRPAFAWSITSQPAKSSACGGAVPTQFVSPAMKMVRRPGTVATIYPHAKRPSDNRTDQNCPDVMRAVDFGVNGYSMIDVPMAG
jgi:hypothetical protein